METKKKESVKEPTTEPKGAVKEYMFPELRKTVEARSLDEAKKKVNLK